MFGVSWFFMKAAVCRSGAAHRHHPIAPQMMQRLLALGRLWLRLPHTDLWIGIAAVVERQQEAEDLRS